ncbi:MAG TPA: alpha-isopropylmalate synthase regulatory domain-containing protein [Candidatus Nanoarchaeia archaeon]|nr:alpha-isopropylmalate synthase regulatory domain-containing protein [Candidatus Nanoarchaeia archaeon]
MAREVEILDTTLRDGRQNIRATISEPDMMELVRMLDDLGVQIIELGFPTRSSKDMDAFKDVRNFGLRNSKISAFGMTRRKEFSVDKDPNLACLVETQAEVVTIFGKTDPLHVTAELGAKPEENLEMIYESIDFLKRKAHVKQVIFDAEHFFKGFRRDRNYAMDCLRTAESAGASPLVLCDTDGGTMTTPLKETVEYVVKGFKESGVPIGIHVHNDCGLAVANTLAAVEAGVTHIQGTINGVGERTGNADLMEVIPNLELKMGYVTVKSRDLTKLKSISDAASVLLHLPVRKDRPYVGDDATATKAGTHSKHPEMYLHFRPEAVGNVMKLYGSEMSGRHNFITKAKQFGIDLSMDEAGSVMRSVKRKSRMGYQFEKADANLYIVMLESKNDWVDPFNVTSCEIASAWQGKERPVSYGLVAMDIDSTTEGFVEFGKGPVNSFDKALRRCIVKTYPEISNMELTDFYVDVVDISKGTKSRVRANVKISVNGSPWSAQGLSYNILKASGEALVTGYKACLEYLRRS